MDGNIIVDGMLASCYASFNNESRTHNYCTYKMTSLACRLDLWWKMEDCQFMQRLAKKVGDWALPYSQSRD